MKIGVVGAGISGLSVAQMLNNKHEVTLFEGKQQIGGLVKCERINDCLFHKVGGHVFNSRNQNVLDWFWSFFKREEEFVKAKRNAKIFINDKIIGYPIENYLYHFEQPVIERIVHELIDLQRGCKKQPFDYDNFEEFLRGNFGNQLFELYFKPYNEKIWKVDLKNVAMEWLEGKLPMPNFEEIFVNNISRKEEDSMVHSTFYYPRENGSQFIIDRLSKDLEILKGNEVNKVEHLGNKIVLNDTYSFDKIIYTGDIRNLPPTWNSLLLKENVSLSYLKSLKSNGTSNLFCETDDTDISWLYIPEPFTKAHRIIYTGNFSNSNNRGSQRNTCVVEFSGEVPSEVMVEEIKKLPGNLIPVTYNYEPNSYVIQDKQTRSIISDAKKILEDRGVFLLGRFAEWEYYNMDKAIEKAMEISQKIQYLN